MKNVVKPFLMLIIVIGVGNVAFANALVHKVPKMKNTVIVVIDDLSEVSDFVGLKDNSVVPVFPAAILPEPILVPEGKTEFIKETKPVYCSPHVDRKWIWWNSIITNS